jgi:hypothetical protein
VEHAGQLELDRRFPWRVVAVVAGIVAIAELFVLLAVAGVHLVPSLHLRHAPPRAVTTTTTPAAPAVTHPAATTPPHAKPQPLRPRSRVSVLVMNGNGITHAAADEAARLLGRGYRAATATDAPSHSYARSLVLFAPGYEREGKRLARDAGVVVVGPVDGMTPAQLKGSQLVVILGGS